MIDYQDYTREKCKGKEREVTRRRRLRIGFGIDKFLEWLRWLLWVVAWFFFW
jgi:hypothetical protein